MRDPVGIINVLIMCNNMSEPIALVPKTSPEETRSE